MQYIFTSVVGRSGQFSLADTLNRYGIKCYAEAEPPDLLIKGKYVPKWLRYIQRKYIVTNEMLGRGKALKWYDENKTDKLDYIVSKKIDRINSLKNKKQFSTYIEVSKFFQRTQFESFYRKIPTLGLIKLTRDPISNAKSFLNRNKLFYLDNNFPESPNNCLNLPVNELSQFQLYLWSWFEIELRFHRFVKTYNINRIFKIKTEDLNSKKRIVELFEYFNIDYNYPENIHVLNTNISKGFSKTIIDKKDITEYKLFLKKVPKDAIDKIEYLNDFSISDMI